MSGEPFATIFARSPGILRAMVPAERWDGARLLLDEQGVEWVAWKLPAGLFFVFTELLARIPDAIEPPTMFRRDELPGQLAKIMTASFGLPHWSAGWQQMAEGGS